MVFFLCFVDVTLSSTPTAKLISLSLKQDQLWNLPWPPKAAGVMSGPRDWKTSFRFYLCSLGGRVLGHYVKYKLHIRIHRQCENVPRASSTQACHVRPCRSTPDGTMGLDTACPWWELPKLQIHQVTEMCVLQSATQQNEQKPLHRRLHSQNLVLQKYSNGQTSDKTNQRKGSCLGM